MLSLIYQDIFGELLMPVFKDFSENGEFLGSRDEPLNSENLDRYFKENGIEKTKGYLDALRDVEKQLDKCYTKYLSHSQDGSICIPNSGAILKRNIEKFMTQESELIDLLEVTIQKNNKTTLDQ